MKLSWQQFSDYFKIFNENNDSNDDDNASDRIGFTD